MIQLIQEVIDFIFGSSDTIEDLESDSRRILNELENSNNDSANGNDEDPVSLGGEYLKNY